MNAEVIREVEQELAVFDDQSLYFGSHLPHRRGGIEPGVYLGFGKAKNLRQFPVNRLIPKRDIGRQQTHVLRPIALKDVIDDIIPLIPGKIYVKIRRTRPVLIDETLKIEV